MKYFLIFSFISILASCGKESDYPRSYTFSHVDQSDEGLFLLSSPTSTTILDPNTGSYGENRSELKVETKETIKLIFDLQEIELLSENTVRIHIIIDQVNIDTIVTYSKEDKNIVIEALADSDLIFYDSENDQFVVCGFTTIALPGPNVINPGPPYYDVLVEDCLEGGNLNDHLNYILSKDNYVALDTIGIFITKFIYK